MQPLLDDIRILDLTQLLPGPYASMVLADLGAEVVKVEPPGGDPVRYREGSIDGRSYTFHIRNRNKKSISLDLKSEEGREVFFELVETADAVLEGYRPGVADRLGIGYDDVRSVDDEVVYCSLSGYGQDGPYADRPGHDINYVGISGLLGLTGDTDGEPIQPGYPVADFTGGLYAAFGIVAALIGKLTGGGGEYVDVSMTDVVASFSVGFLDSYDSGQLTPERGRTPLSNHPGYGVFEAADGEYLALGILETKFWNNFCNLIDEPELKEDYGGISEDGTEIEEVFADAISERPLDRWLELFDEHDIPGTPVHDYEEVLSDPQLLHRGMFQQMSWTSSDGETEEHSIKQVDTPITFEGDRKVEKQPGSTLGADTEDLLTEVGYDDDEIESLREHGVLTIDPSR